MYSFIPLGQTLILILRGLPFSLTLSALLLTSATWSQAIGVPIPVAFISSQATLSLDFANQDYQLILYSARRDEPDTSRSYSFTVSGAFSATKPVVHLLRAVATATTGHESILRREEADLARPKTSVNNSLHCT